MNGHLRVYFKSNWNAKQGHKKDVFDILLDGSLKHEHVGAIEGAPDGLSEGTYFWG